MYAQNTFRESIGDVYEDLNPSHTFELTAFETVAQTLDRVSVSMLSILLHVFDGIVSCLWVDYECAVFSLLSPQVVHGFIQM